MHTVEEITTLFRQNGGLMRTKELSAEKIYYVELQMLLNMGVLQKVRYGCYRLAGETLDEMQTVARLFPDGIFCGETALSHYGYLAALPAQWHLAVGKDSGKSRFNLDYPFVKPYYLEPNLLGIGLTTVETPHGAVRMYDRERVICDCLRYRNKIDRAVLNGALRSYIADPKRNLSRLWEYANRLRVAKTAREMLGLWL